MYFWPAKNKITASTISPARIHKITGQALPRLRRAR